MFKHARVTCLSHNETVWNICLLYKMIREGWDQRKGIDGSTCDFLIEETGDVYPNLITPKELKRQLSEEK